MTSAPPVAHEGMDAKIGEKNIDIKKATPVVIAVKPVFPPSKQDVNRGLWSSVESHRRTTNACSALNECSDGTSPH